MPVTGQQAQAPAARDREKAREQRVRIGGAVVAAEGAPEEIAGHERGQVRLDLGRRQELARHPQPALELHVAAALLEGRRVGGHEEIAVAEEVHRAAEDLAVVGEVAV